MLVGLIKYFSYGSEFLWLYLMVMLIEFIEFMVDLGDLMMMVVVNCVCKGVIKVVLYKVMELRFKRLIVFLWIISK